jgi:hypothetical protein
LVAYLDGELNEAEAGALETKLTQSVSARREVEALEQTWELLEHLPRPQAPPELVSRTLTQVSEFDSRGGRLASAAREGSRVAMRIVACLLVAAATLLMAYVATRWLWPDPTARLAQNLPLVENLDEYKEVGSIELLKQLDESPEFNSESP